MKGFWKWICLFAWRKWVGGLKGPMPMGVPHVRDPENPCTWFEPFPNAEPDGRCETDGHYLCCICVHRVTKELGRFY